VAESAAARITGTTRLYAVLGDPITQVQAPTLVNDLFRRLGRDAVLVPVHARPGDLTTVLAGLRAMENLDGLLVTVPHKAAACAFADRVSATVAVTGSTNAVRREPDGSWYADNFDGAGFVTGLRQAGHDLGGRQAVLVGAGGAGSAIAAALLDAGVAGLAVCDPDTVRLHALLDRLTARWPGRVAGTDRPDLAGVQLAINATPLGLRPDDPLPFDPAGLPAGAVVADIIMQPRETRLLCAAASRGLSVHQGQHMLLHQLDAYRTFFRL
jgi:shikimate dehydrogenase